MKLFRLVLRDLVRRRWRPILTLVLLLTALWGVLWAFPELAAYIHSSRWPQLLVLTFVVWIVLFVCRSLTDIFSLHRKETAITWCQILILVAIGVWIVGFVIIFDAKGNPALATGLGVIGGVLTWVFNDTLKGVVGFVHLRMLHLLNIGDWIQIPKYGVDGTVSHVTLTTVTLSNWDNTTSSIPTRVLYDDHLINLQNMTDGKTHGRRMYKTFTLDTSWVHNLTATEAERLRQSQEILRYMPAEEIREDMLNAHLFRLYLFHWLMNHPHVSQHPRLVVRWMDLQESGLPLQIYAFITDGGVMAFEWQQSQIIEHIVESLGWFGLRLYQSPSAYDVSNSNIHLTDKEVSYRKEGQI